MTVQASSMFANHVFLLNGHLSSAVVASPGLASKSTKGKNYLPDRFAVAHLGLGVSLAQKTEYATDNNMA